MRKTPPRYALAVPQWRDTALVEPPERHTLDTRLTPQVGEHLGERVGAPELSVAIGADDQHESVLEAPQHVTQKEERRLRCPMQVIKE